MIAWIIYTVGVIVAFIIVRAQLRDKAKKKNETYTWNDVKYVIFWSLLSWYGLLGVSCIYGVLSILDWIEKHKDFFKKEPPKWM